MNIFKKDDLEIIRKEIRIYIYKYIRKNENSKISQSLAIILEPWKDLYFTKIKNFNKKYNALLKLQGLPKDIIMYLELYKLIDSLLSNNKNIFNVFNVKYIKNFYKRRNNSLNSNTNPTNNSKSKNSVFTPIKSPIKSAIKSAEKTKNSLNSKTNPTNNPNSKSKNGLTHKKSVTFNNKEIFFYNH